MNPLPLLLGLWRQKLIFWKEVQTKAIVLGATIIAYMGGVSAKLEVWWNQVNGFHDQIQGWLNQAKTFNVDLGLGFRMANWIFPVEEFFQLIGQLVGIAIVILSIRAGIFLFNLGARILSAIA